jgi:hypothetical protein
MASLSHLSGSDLLSLRIGYGERETDTGTQRIDETWEIERRVGFRRIYAYASWGPDTYYNADLDLVETAATPGSLPVDYVLEPGLRLADGWRWNPRLGTLNDERFPWVYAEHLGWLWVPPTADRDALWVYSKTLGWLFLKYPLRTPDEAIPLASYESVPSFLLEPSFFPIDASDRVDTSAGSAGDSGSRIFWVDRLNSESSHLIETKTERYARERAELVAREEAVAFPLLYSADRHSWLWLELEAAAAGRWFYDFSRAEWFSIPE